MTERRKMREGQRSRGGRFISTAEFCLYPLWLHVDLRKILERTKRKSEGKEEGKKLSAGGGVWTWMP